ncbi:MAG: ureidoacrylate peracid hydrolase [Alphaproteobacteria bacterium]|jgi:ureidoacrylate peracid hydrolase|nr:ureidoacrylate peracid hydrolase [Alphaproteobacteria bacterium]
MHKLAISPAITARVKARSGKVHPFDTLNARRTALLVIDMQNYFVQPGAQGESATAREVVPAINHLAAELRHRGGHVVWVRNSTTDTKDWSTFHNCLMTTERRDRRYKAMDEANGGEGFEFWHALDIQPGDAKIAKKRFSAFIQGSSGIERHLRSRDIDTVLIAGTATNVCCESTARDAMMLNFKTVMVADALAAQTDEAHNASLSAFYSNFGDVQTVSEVLQSLDQGTAKAAKAG